MEAKQYPRRRLMSARVFSGTIRRDSNGVRARHAGGSPTAAYATDIRALVRSLRSGLQARMYQACISYRKASARGSSEIAARSPGMVVVGEVVAPMSARAFPVIYVQRRRSGIALVYPAEPSREIGDHCEGRLWGMKSGSRRQC